MLHYARLGNTGTGISCYLCVHIMTAYLLMPANIVQESIGMTGFIRYGFTANHNKLLLSGHIFFNTRPLN